MIKRSELLEKFGPIDLAKNRWIRERDFMGIYHVPEFVTDWKWSFTGEPTKRIYCNKLMFEPLTKALTSLKDKGILSELKTFDGSFNIRLVRGSTNILSIHSWGLALDANAKENPLGKESKQNPDLVKCFKDAGFIWGGDFSRIDAQHFQLVEE